MLHQQMQRHTMLDRILGGDVDVQHLCCADINFKTLLSPAPTQCRKDFFTPPNSCAVLARGSSQIRHQKIGHYRFVTRPIRHQPIRHQARSPVKLHLNKFYYFYATMANNQCLIHIGIIVNNIFNKTTCNKKCFVLIKWFITLLIHVTIVFFVVIVDAEDNKCVYKTITKLKIWTTVYIVKLWFKYK